MKVTYKRSLPLWLILFTVFGIVIGIIGTSSVFGLFTISDVFESIRVIFFIILAFGFALSGSQELYYRYFYFPKTETIITDEGIFFKNKIEAYIQWEEIISCEARFINNFLGGYILIGVLALFSKDFFLIIISSTKNRIIIGSHAENIKEIIEFIKSRLGHEFKTFQIPLEFKYK